MAVASHAGVVAVIEDDREARCALGRLLTAGGFDTALFESAETFIGASTGTSWLCLIVDVQLGGMSGLDLQLYLHAREQVVPVVIVTANRSDLVRRRAEQAGCAAFLAKPFSSDAILAIVESIARRAAPDPRDSSPNVQ